MTTSVFRFAEDGSNRMYVHGEEVVLASEVERLQAAVDTAHGAMHASEYVGGPTEREAWQTAMRVLGSVVTEHKGASDRLT